MDESNEPAPQAVPAKPDAVMLERIEPGPTSRHRIGATCDLVEPILGKPCYIREVGGNRLLATRSPVDTLYFPTEHDLAGRERYEWADGPRAGIKVGTLVAEARP